MDSKLAVSSTNGTTCSAKSSHLSLPPVRSSIKSTCITDWSQLGRRFWMFRKGIIKQRQLFMPPMNKVLVMLYWTFVNMNRHCQYCFFCRKPASRLQDRTRMRMSTHWVERPGLGFRIPYPSSAQMMGQCTIGTLQGCLYCPLLSRAKFPCLILNLKLVSIVLYGVLCCVSLQRYRWTLAVFYRLNKAIWYKAIMSERNITTLTNASFSISWVSTSFHILSLNTYDFKSTPATDRGDWYKNPYHFQFTTAPATRAATYWREPRSRCTPVNWPRALEVGTKSDQMTRRLRQKSWPTCRFRKFEQKIWCEHLVREQKRSAQEPTRVLIGGKTRK